MHRRLLEGTARTISTGSIVYENSLVYEIKTLFVERIEKFVYYTSPEELEQGLEGINEIIGA